MEIIMKNRSLANSIYRNIVTLEYDSLIFWDCLSIYQFTDRLHSLQRKITGDTDSANQTWISK